MRSAIIVDLAFRTCMNFKDEMEIALNQHILNFLLRSIALKGLAMLVHVIIF